MIVYTGNVGKWDIYFLGFSVCEWWRNVGTREIFVVGNLRRMHVVVVVDVDVLLFETRDDPYPRKTIFFF